MDFLKKNDPELIFLDLQMPSLTGLDFLKIIRNPPQVIITTAFSQYALEAFELDVRDYLMKPFSFDRFLKAVSRITPKPDSAQLHKLQNATRENSFAFFNVNKVMVKVMFDDILYVESMREYAYIHLPEKKVITRIGIGEIEKQLTPNFHRVHRSFLINQNKITAYTAEEIFINHISIPIGVNYRKLVDSSLLAALKF
jgi:DNA-binding LytR/AlgR family response regulator